MEYMAPYMYQLRMLMSNLPIMVLDKHNVSSYLPNSRNWKPQTLPAFCFVNNNRDVILANTFRCYETSHAPSQGAMCMINRLQILPCNNATCTKWLSIETVQECRNGSAKGGEWCTDNKQERVYQDYTSNPMPTSLFQLAEEGKNDAGMRLLVQSSYTTCLVFILSSLLSDVHTLSDNVYTSAPHVGVDR